MATKLPYFPFYTGDWLKDDALTLCAPATRGVWIDLLARMHERDRSGELCGTADQLARAARCSTVEFVHAATELQATGTADVSERNGSYIIRNRRMHAESLERKANADRQMRYRNAIRDGTNDTEKTQSPEDVIEVAFEKFWKAFPPGRRKSKGRAREAYRTALTKVDVATLHAAAEAYSASEEGRGKYVKMPSSWLNGECWSDATEAWRNHDIPMAEVGYRSITKEEFAELARLEKFKDPPRRNVDNPLWVFGTLRDGSKVECREFYPPKPTP